jgi:hypothetical protein
MVISKCISQKILGKLTSATTAANMWRKLEKLYLKKSPKSIFTLQARFFEYKMSATDDIASHIQNITEMATLLADLGNPLSNTMIISKIICSLRPSYNSIVAAWSNVHESQQTLDYLEEKLLRHKGLMEVQRRKDDPLDEAFFTRSQHLYNKPLT